MNEDDHTQIMLMQRDIAEIKAALIGSDTHKNDGIIDRLCKLERFQANWVRVIGIASSVGVFFGAILSYLKDKLL